VSTPPADRRPEPLSDFFRRAAANRAADVLADQRTVTLAEDEAIRFLDALESSAVPESGSG
jgi:uncharacterized protein (DUF1778 family)